MKRILLITLLSIAFLNNARAVVKQWRWAKTDTTVAQMLNPGYLQNTVAAHGAKVLWAVLQNNKIVLNEVQGAYKLIEYDTAGNMLQSAMIDGTFHLIDMHADAQGNWYMLGQYYDTLRFANGTSLIRGTASFDPDYFLARVNANDLSLEWVKPLGADYSNYATSFTIKNNKLWIPVDSGASSTLICNFDLATGARTVLWEQIGQSRTSSIVVDDNDNVYLAGSCAFTMINFNGHTETGPSAYPAYFARYHAGGQFDWVQWMDDVTCVQRKLSMVNNNALYYTGTINDTFSIDGHPIHRAAWVYDFMISMIDSNGHVQWVRQLNDTLSGDASIENEYHAVVTNDGSLNIAFQNRKYNDWGNGVISNTSLNETASVLNVNTTGLAQWVKNIDASYATVRMIVSNGTDVFLTGQGYDSTALQFDNVSLPAPWQKYTPYLAKLSTVEPNAVAAINTGNQSLHLAPNPATASISVYGLNNEHANINVKDLVGRSLYSTTIANVQQLKIDVSAYPKGMYIIEIRNNERLTILKAVVQ